MNGVGAGVAPQPGGVAVEPVQVDDDEMDSSAPPALELFGITREDGTEKHGSGEQWGWSRRWVFSPSMNKVANMTQSIGEQ